MQLVEDIRSVAPASVVLNWECCSGYHCEAFHAQGEDAAGCRDQNMELMHLAIERGHMVTCADFSVKALAKQWCERRLGPNPFVKIGEFGGRMELRFDPVTLAQCPSSQLQMVGEMCAEGRAELSAMPMTMAFAIDSRRAATEVYTLTVLSTVVAMDGLDLATLPEHLTCRVGGQPGACGHVLLEYPSGGKLLASAGHWIDLAYLGGVSEERLLQVVAATQSRARQAEISSVLMSSAPGSAERMQSLQTVAWELVQRSAPCSYSMRS